MDPCSCLFFRGPFQYHLVHCPLSQASWDTASFSTTPIQLPWCNQKEVKVDTYRWGWGRRDPARGASMPSLAKANLCFSFLSRAIHPECTLPPPSSASALAFHCRRFGTAVYLSLSQPLLIVGGSHQAHAAVGVLVSGGSGSPFRDPLTGAAADSHPAPYTRHLIGPSRLRPSLQRCHQAPPPVLTFRVTSSSPSELSFS